MLAEKYKLSKVTVSRNKLHRMTELAQRCFVNEIKRFGRGGRDAS